MMTETVIKWDRPQMVGNFYRPYRVNWMEAVYELEKTFSGTKRDYAERKGKTLHRKYKVDMMTRHELEQMLAESLQPYEAGSDPDGYTESEEWLFDEDDEREWERDMEW